MPTPAPLGVTVFRTIAESRMVDYLMVFGHGPGAVATSDSQARIEVERALDRWTRKGLLGFDRGPAGERLFDPAEVKNTLVHAGVTGKDEFWQTNYIPTFRRMLCALKPRATTDDASLDTPPVIPGLPARRMRLRLERDFDLAPFPQDTRVRLRLPAPLADATLRDLRIDASDLPGAQISASAGRVDYQLDAAGQGTVTVGYDASFEGLPDTGTPAGELASTGLTAQERGWYTRPAEGLIEIDDTIRRQAQAAGPPGIPHEAAARRLFDLVIQTVKCGVMQYGDLEGTAPSSRAWAVGWTDCQVAASIFCGLCRARGIPARLVSGFPLHPALLANHYWVQVWIEGRGWLPYDFTEWTLSAGGHDARWQGVFQGVTDYRMKFQVFPRLFTGFGSIRFPRWWHMVLRSIPGGTETTFENAQTGALVYRERCFMTG